MKILTNKKIQQIEQVMADINTVLMELPVDALGSGATRSDRLTRLYTAMCSLAYELEGIKGLNKVVIEFADKAKTMDDIIGISQTHLGVLRKYETNTVLQQSTGKSSSKEHTGKANK